MKIEHPLLNEVINKLLDQGLKISIFKDDKGIIWFDLNTMSKSDLYIRADENNSLITKGRYEYLDGVINSYEELLDTAIRHMCGRRFINEDWKKILVSNKRLRMKQTLEFN